MRGGEPGRRRRRGVRGRAGGPGGADRRAGETAAFLAGRAGRGARPARADRPAAPARDQHPRRRSPALPRGRRAGPVRVRRGAGAPAGRGRRPSAARGPPAAAGSGRQRGLRRRPARTGRRGRVRRRGCWPNGCTSGSPRTGWPAPGSASRRSPRTARSCTGSGGTTALLTAAAIADRVRWQLDGWLSGTPAAAPAPRRPGRPPASSGCAWCPTACCRTSDSSPACGARRARRRERAHRALNRVQGLLGPEAVVTAVLGGGRSPADQVRLVPWGDERHPPGPPAPWPGRLPSPAPALVLPAPLPATVRDATGEPVGVSARLLVTAAPARLAIGNGPARRDRRLGRAVAGRRTLVGARRGPPPGPVPGRPGRRQGLPALAGRRPLVGGGHL